jgi:hypothetical protein
MEEKITKTLMGKLRQPIHIDYISKYILKVSINETRNIIDKLVEDNIIEESKYAKDYYVVRNI